MSVDLRSESVLSIGRGNHHFVFRFAPGCEDAVIGEVVRRYEAGQVCWFDAWQAVHWLGRELVVAGSSTCWTFR